MIRFSLSTAAPPEKSRQYFHRLLIAILAATIVVPPLYLIVVIQYSAVVFPYWDAIPLINTFASYYDGTLSFDELAGWHSQSRPLIPRIIFLLNAIATGWDIRSEYTFIYLTIFGLLGVHLCALRAMVGHFRSIHFLAVAALASILICSPVAHHTHWYSVMLILTLSNLFAAASLFLVAFRPGVWWANILAALLGWMSTYSSSAGLFIFPVVVITFQLASPGPWRPSRFSLFWLVNLVLLYVVYFPNFPGPGPKPTLFDLIEFCLIYLGNPLASLLWYHPGSQFNPALTSATPAVFGLVLLIACLFAARAALNDLKNHAPDAYIFFLFSGYAIVSAIVTAWGRAHGDVIANANAGRYAIFSDYLMFALIYYGTATLLRAPDFAGYSSRWSRTSMSVVLAMIAASAITYLRALPDYRTAHGMNAWLSDAYSTQGRPSDLDGRVYPDLNYFHPAKAALFRLELGPYRYIPVTLFDLTSGPFVRPVRLDAGTTITQRVDMSPARLHSISLNFVTWGRKPSRYRILWKVFVVAADGRHLIGHGAIHSTDLSDWSPFSLNNLSGPDIASQATEIELTVPEGQDTSAAAGLALYRASHAALSTPFAINGKPVADNAVLSVTLRCLR